MNDDKIRRLLKEGPGFLVSLSVDFFNIKDEFLEKSGWTSLKYDDIVRGDWFIPLYEVESKNIVKGLSQSPSAVKFWEEKARNWRMHISEHIKNLETLPDFPDRAFHKARLPLSVQDVFPKGSELFHYTHKVTTNSGYLLSFPIGDNQDLMEISFSRMTSIDPFLRDLAVIADRLQEVDEEEGARMANAIQKFCLENNHEL